MSKFHVPSALLADEINAYSDAGAERKVAFHRDGRTFLKRLARELALARGTFDVRSNEGGIAVSGEVTLHSDTLYVQLSRSTLLPGVQILYRRCKGRRDYHGEANHFVAVRNLAAENWRLGAFVSDLRTLGQLDEALRRAA